MYAVKLLIKERDYCFNRVYYFYTIGTTYYQNCLLFLSIKIKKNEYRTIVHSTWTTVYLKKLIIAEEPLENNLKWLIKVKAEEHKKSYKK